MTLGKGAICTPRSLIGGHRLFNCPDPIDQGIHSLPQQSNKYNKISILLAKNIKMSSNMHKFHLKEG